MTPDLHQPNFRRRSVVGIPGIAPGIEDTNAMAARPCAFFELDSGNSARSAG
jgi:hypothetical protein